MNKRQKKEIENISQNEGIGEDVLLRINKWDSTGVLKPHFKIRPLLIMEVHEEEFSSEIYEEYFEEYY